MGNEGSRFEPGDVLYRKLEGNPLLYHYGVYIGHDRVIDFSQEGIQRRSFEEFASGYEVHVRSYLGTRPRAEIVETALYYLKDEEEWGDYNLVFNNCEHFASFCATGEKKSGQVKKAVIAGAVGVGVAAVVGLTVIGGMALMTRRPRDEIVETALYYLKDEEEWGDYNLAFNNCEHFACFCATGVKRSGQVEKTVICHRREEIWSGEEGSDSRSSRCRCGSENSF
eukprot:TRINITY_DN173_c0_g1_i5.p1 TRINITY_DN173_c0_g1~~TRINITY_DN173_c0_g1_i5.p1  ORF type:complete len:225 (+),score=40.68 TRINITY_DN173_c0_g1_i5:87-761(+)